MELLKSRGFRVSLLRRFFVPVRVCNPYLEKPEDACLCVARRQLRLVTVSSNP